MAPAPCRGQARKFHFFLTWAGHQACLCLSEDPALRSGPRHETLPWGWRLLPCANAPAGQTGCIPLHPEKGQRATPPTLGRRHGGHRQSGI